MMEEMLPGCGFKTTPHITSRLKTLKRLWQAAYDIVYGPNTSGFGWDLETKLVTADKEVWGHSTSSSSHFSSVLASEPKTVQLNPDFAIHIPTNSNLVTQVSLPEWTFNLAVSHCQIQKLLIMGKEKRTDSHLFDLGITMEDVEAFRKHRETLWRGGRGGRSKETSKDPNAYDEYVEATKWKRELEAKEERKKKRAAKKNDQTLVTRKRKAPSDDDAHSVFDSSPNKKK
ncbi:hypothetical protein K1719_038434 [Acacia pycnantha]|nr:hypothetical protein K1719_038434 [Acacia pycnantha]